MKISKKLIFVFLFSLSWAIYIIITKFAFNLGENVFNFTAQLFLVSTLILFTHNILFKRDNLKAIDKKDFWIAIITGIFAALGMLFGFIGLKLSTAINYGFLIKTTIVFVTVLAFFFFKERFNLHKILLLIILLVGAYLISTGGQSLIPASGDLIILLGAFFLSSSAIASKHLLKKMDPSVVANLRTLFSFITLLTVALFLGVFSFSFSTITIVLAAGVFNVMIALYLNKTLKVASASYMTMMSMSVPIMTVIMSLVFLGESLNLFQIIGGILIIISGIVVHKKGI